ncbi:hypothetical protein GUITHDRAFT_106912 [Guillardia theta CCMP2712]|uniref:Uncharacterized protein n=2 Tax=Guillardia theta TaxID=55529 RepID=L1JGM3_GUITC|nr:hypothetical protein GUITHDRAFT_106912 [Guillardia theta CCMP2712]EKX47472.1 hypothetical protein GUITHDRAFT_106912 [Guillardia theta CCMP2712]|eukprot:XP_005834452.1 hypothetical protein GUITHDRAFT_106912 [Guillardia theta CCMP2712]
MSTQNTMKLSNELRKTIRILHQHFKGRNGNPTGEISPYRRFLVNACKERVEPARKNEAESKEAFLDLEAYKQYLDALVQRKALLSQFGGDAVRGISARQRIENTSSRVGLKLPKYNVDEEDLSEYGKRLGLKDKKQTSIREDLNSIAKNAAQNSDAPSSQ